MRRLVTKGGTLNPSLHFAVTGGAQQWEAFQYARIIHRQLVFPLGEALIQGIYSLPPRASCSNLNRGEKSAKGFQFSTYLLSHQFIPKKIRAPNNSFPVVDLTDPRFPPYTLPKSRQIAHHSYVCLLVRGDGEKIRRKI